jgi:hypothetical protein
VFLAQLLVKVPHVQVEVLVPVQTQNPLGLPLRNPPLAWHPTPPVQ